MCPRGTTPYDYTPRLGFYSSLGFLTRLIIKPPNTVVDLLCWRTSIRCPTVAKMLLWCPASTRNARNGVQWMSLLRYCLTGFCVGVGIPLFGVLAVKLWRLPNSALYHGNVRLSMVAGGLCLACADLVFVYLTYYDAMPRLLFIGCVAGGATIGILAVYVYRWRRASGK